MSAADRRRGVPIMGYVGSNGGGKSLAMCVDTMGSLDAGRPVLSTMRLLDWRNPRRCDDERCRDDGHPDHAAAHPFWVRWESWQQLLELTHCDVLMDEVTGIAGSRDTSSLPSEVANIFMQQRRADRVIRWSAPSWARADVLLRETSQAVTVCSGFLPVREPGRLWPRNRLFLWKTYDVRGLDSDHVAELSVGAGERSRTVRAVAPLTRQWFWGPGSEAFKVYDTMAPVARVGTVVESGRCLTCNGRRRARACTCDE